MTTDFTILSGETVPDNYSWDIGAPYGLADLEVPAFSTSNYISGYAPGLLVVFKNNSTNSPNLEIAPNTPLYANFSWNFGDYYNNITNNISLSCPAPVRHIFVMPGKYSVTLTHTETYSFLINDDSILCKDKYDINWFWDNIQCNVENQKFWNELECGQRFEKRWDNELACLQKYCKDWSWLELNCNNFSKTTWEQTKNNQEFEKRWEYEANDTACVRQFSIVQSTTESNLETVIKKFIVEVVEIPPKASLYSITRPTLGVSPLNIQLTCRTTRCGSYPIDRIDWDFGDGSPVKIVTRQSASNDNQLISTNVFANDPLDPRNYDVTHTYTRNSEQYAIFYPSITAYSANTGTYDTCSTTIGPITLPPTNNQVSLLKVKNTSRDALYAISYNDSCSLLTTTNINKPLKTLITTPPNKIRDGFEVPISYFGNNGNNYPPTLPQSCEGFELVIPYTRLVVEESNTFTSQITAITQENLGNIVVTQ